jgi:hypothetical protein
VLGGVVESLGPSQQRAPSGAVSRAICLPMAAAAVVTFVSADIDGSTGVRDADPHGKVFEDQRLREVIELTAVAHVGQILLSSWASTG